MSIFSNLYEKAAGPDDLHGKLLKNTAKALDLWRDPSGVAALLDDWREKLAANPHKTTEADSPPNKQGGVG